MTGPGLKIPDHSTFDRPSGPTNDQHTVKGALRTPSNPALHVAATPKLTSVDKENSKFP
ncbi:hypothetical protein GCM10022207_14100 [Streptomyces lannensis]|uniref:Uncharacterized protein n=1 Tax=Streptomyces lannensis TaxID=766498 RepID=A0ABP7JT33_9ACTN